MARNIIATVSRAALHHNYNKIREKAPSSKIMAMVKANAYGHGLATVALALKEADALRVASIEEALLVRKIGVQTELVLMEGIFREEELSLIQTHHLTQVVHHWPQIQALKNFKGTYSTPFRVWIKINTGMNRLGFSLEEFDEAYQVLSTLPQVKLIGMMTHFSQADEPDSPQTHLQIARFNQAVGERVGAKCLANSAGILAWPQSHEDWVRPGLILYGASPFQHTTALDYDLQPVMTLSSEIIAIRELSAGDKVGYSGTWESPHAACRVGIVAMGYGDGYPWHARNGTPILVAGQKTQTVGRISMDMLAVDLSSLKSVKVGDPVILWGEGLPIEAVAKGAGTIPYELFCRFTERVTVKEVSSSSKLGFKA